MRTTRWTLSSLMDAARLHERRAAIHLALYARARKAGSRYGYDYLRPAEQHAVAAARLFDVVTERFVSPAGGKR